jgi:hypothetical protein
LAVRAVCDVWSGAKSLTVAWRNVDLLLISVYIAYLCDLRLFYYFFWNLDGILTPKYTARRWDIFSQNEKCKTRTAEQVR